VLTLLAVLAAVPLAFGAGLWALQERLIFLPDSRPLAASPPFRIETLATPDGLSLRFLAAEAGPGAPVILHLHGNGGQAGDRAAAMAPFVAAGFSVVLAGYRGYGGNPGTPSEQGLATDAAAHLAWARARHPAAPLVIWGESLGTGLATRLAEGRADVAGLVLESPFTSVADIAAAQYPWLPTRALLRHPFESLSRLPAIAAPVLVVHAEGDRVVPPEQGRRMAAAARDGRLLMLPGWAHPPVLNDPTGRAAPAVRGFLREVTGR
jgi:uncharacterized protein